MRSSGTGRKHENKVAHDRFDRGDDVVGAATLCVGLLFPAIDFGSPALGVLADNSEFGLEHLVGCCSFFRCRSRTLPCVDPVACALWGCIFKYAGCRIWWRGTLEHPDL